MNAEILVRRNGTTLERIQPNGMIMVGRDSSCQIRLATDDAERFSVSIEARGTSLIVQNHGSRPVQMGSRLLPAKEKAVWQMSDEIQFSDGTALTLTKPQVLQRPAPMRETAPPRPAMVDQKQARPAPQKFPAKSPDVGASSDEQRKASAKRNMQLAVIIGCVVLSIGMLVSLQFSPESSGEKEVQFAALWASTQEIAPLRDTMTLIQRAERYRMQQQRTEALESFMRARDELTQLRVNLGINASDTSPVNEVVKFVCQRITKLSQRPDSAESL